MSLEDTIETTLNQIQNVMSANSIVGDEITTKDKVIIPISKVTLGFGVGTVDKESESETNIGGAGGGGSIDPIAFLVVSDDVQGPQGVQLVPVTPSNSLDELLGGAAKVLFDIIGGGLSSDNKASKTKTVNVDSVKTKVKK